MNSVEILGVRVDDVIMDEGIEALSAFVREPRLHQIATINPEFIIAARHNPDFARVLAASDLNLPDGANLIRAARFLRQPLRERVAGSDLIWHLAGRSSKEGWKIFLLGAREGVAAQAAEKLSARYPGLQIAAVYAGSPEPREDGVQVARVLASGAQILLVAYGAPAQEFWIARNRARLSGSVRVAMGVGGAFDFIAGRLPRAPKWMQRGGLEWLFRLIQEPRRWRRQLALVEFVWLVMRARPG